MKENTVQTITSISAKKKKDFKGSEVNIYFSYKLIFSVSSSSESFEYLEYLPTSNHSVLVRMERTTLYIGLGSKIKLSSCFNLFTERGT